MLKIKDSSLIHASTPTLLISCDFSLAAAFQMLGHQMWPCFLCIIGF